MCVTAVTQNDKTDGISFFVVLCCLVNLPLCFQFLFPSFPLPLSLESVFLFVAYDEMEVLKNLDE